MKPRAIPIGTLLVAAALLAPRNAGAAAPPTASSGGEAAPVRAAATLRTAPVLADVTNAGFETGDLSGWQFDAGSADVAIVPRDPPNACFQPEMPIDEDGDGSAFMACMSTGTFFGGTSNGGVRSDLTSGPITFGFKPGSIKISFDVDFQTEETERSIGHDDAFEARLVTAAGTFAIVQLDTFGRTSPGHGLRVEGFDNLKGTQPGCDIAGLRTGHLKVTWTKSVDTIMRATIGRGPVFVEFSISNQGDTTKTSIACVDDIQVRVTKP